MRAVSSDRTSASTATPAPLASSGDTASPLSLDRRRDARSDRRGDAQGASRGVSGADSRPAKRDPGSCNPRNSRSGPVPECAARRRSDSSRRSRDPRNCDPRRHRGDPAVECAVLQRRRNGRRAAAPVRRQLGLTVAIAGEPPGYYFLTPTLATVPAPSGSTPPAPAFYRRTFDVRDIRRDFPILAGARSRPSSGLARQRRHHPEAARGHRSACSLLRA